MTDYRQPSPFDPDVKWIVRHSRMTDVLLFGPFDDLAAANDWCLRNKIPSYPTPLLPPRVEEGGYTGIWEGWKRP